MGSDGFAEKGPILEQPPYRSAENAIIDLVLNLKARCKAYFSRWKLARESPIGWMPRYEDFDWRGLDLPKDQFEELQRVDPALWRREVIQHEELFIDLHDHLPPEMVYERELLICRL